MKTLFRFKQKFLKLIKPLTKNYMPRGAIFFIDLIITLLSALAAFYLLSTVTQKPFFHFYFFNWMLLAIVVLQGIYFYFFESYSGLVRYSNFRDAMKLLEVTAICVVTLLIINQIYYFYTGGKPVLNAALIIYGVFAFSALFLFRITVKRVYDSLISQESSSSAFVLGTDPEDIAMANGLISYASIKVSVNGFLSGKPNYSKKKIFNLPIFSIDQLKKSQKHPRAIIIREEKLEELRSSKNSILSDLLELNLKIYKLPKIQDWDKATKESMTNLREIRIEDLLQRDPIQLNNQKLNGIYQGKTILITGAAGSIGSEIVRQLIPFEPERILLVDHAETPLHRLTLEMDKIYPDVKYEKIIADVRNRNRLNQIFSTFRPQVVFHAAAYKHVPMMEANAIEALSVNFQGTRNVSELARDYEIERFVFISTDKAVNPTNIMGATKRSSELFIQSLSNQKGIKTTYITTRFGNVLGSNGSVIPLFKRQIAEKGPITVTHPEIIRYFMTIDEACQLVLEAGGMGNGGEIYVFDMGNPVKILDLAKHMIRLSGLVPDKDIKIKFTGLRPGEKLYEELLADKELTLKTYHEKILVAKATNNFKEAELTLLLNNLYESIKKYDCAQAARLMRELVPEYHQEKIPVLETVGDKRASN